MGLFGSDLPMCPMHQRCSQWAMDYMKYCLCTRNDSISLILGFVSVFSWAVAEVPQIITNYKEKSSEGLAIGFLVTWIVGDLMNLVGCLLEPATLPTQYYMALLYLATTLILSAQSMYYGHIYHRYTSKRPCHKTESNGKKRKHNHDDDSLEDSSVARISKSTSSLPIPAADDNPSSEAEYYMSARSLSKSHTPAVNFFSIKRTTTSSFTHSSVQEPLLGGHSEPVPESKTMLCVVFTVAIFLCTYNLQLEKNSDFHVSLVKPHQGIVMKVGRKLLQVNGSLRHDVDGTDSTGIGTFLGWGMAAIYMGGRLPQIFLNIRRGHVQGLNPLMFIFALFGNSTYVASILVSSLEWSKIHPNLPWVVESSGCVLLDAFILVQFIYFRHRNTKHRGYSGD